MKALVTGATGLLGGHIVRELLARGHAVRALVRPTSDRSFLSGLDVEYSTGDVLQPDTLQAAVAGCEVVFHAAAIFAYWGHAAAELDNVAGAGTRNVLTAAHRAGVAKVVVTSSSVVLGGGSAAIVRDETSAAVVDPRLDYAVSKFRQEETALATAAALGQPLVLVLPTLCIGPYDHRLGESNAILVQYLKDPYRTSWLGGGNLAAAADVACGHVLAAELGVAGRRYLLGGENLTWQDLHRQISELCGVAGPLVMSNHTASFLAGATYELIGLLTGKRPPTTREQARMVGRYYWYSHERAATELGYRPRPVRAALADALAWLVHSDHLPASVYQQLRLAPEVLAARDRQQTAAGR
jgi:dihydroflavonol-4-reductase